MNKEPEDISVATSIILSIIYLFMCGTIVRVMFRDWLQLYTAIVIVALIILAVLYIIADRHDTAAGE